MQLPVRFPKWLESLQSTGRYTFTREEADQALQISPNALKVALRRLVSKGRIIAPRRGFYVIVPLEYAATGTLPADWFVDALMKHRGKPYYVGLLSAAELHGAAHQRPQELQVVTTVPIRPVVVKRTRIHFFVKSQLAGTPTALTKTATGMIPVSTPEATAFDLVRYASRVGGLDHVATVLVELSEEIKPKPLLLAAQSEPDRAIVQRAGYLIEKFGSRALTGPLAKWLSVQDPGFVPLRAERHWRGPKDEKWRLILNEEITPDL